MTITATDQSAAALLDLLPRLMRFLHQGLRGHPLTLQQLRVLGALAAGERPTGEVAAELGIRPPTLTGLLEPLQRQGLIARRRDPRAWRVVLICLTPAGEDVHHTILMAARRRLVRLIADLPAPDQAALRQALRALAESLQQAMKPSAVPRAASKGGGLAEGME
jgi:DNA-binding MarR family transcriptional regulator